MRYIITQSQLHKFAYKYLDSIFGSSEGKKTQNPHNPDAYRIELKTIKGADTINYYYFGPGEYDDDIDRPFQQATKHGGNGHLQIHPDIVDSLRKLVKARETRVMDMIADWFSEKFQVDVDEVRIYPQRKTPTIY